MTAGALIANAVPASRLADARPALLLDIDGTLAPIAPTPDLAVVPPATIEAIARLVAAGRTPVAIVTGRSVADARRLVPISGVSIIGNHGFELVDDDGQLVVADDARLFEDALRRAATGLAAIARQHGGAFVEDKRWTLSLHYRLAELDAIAPITAAAVALSEESGLRLTRGKEVIELRPPVEVNKGTASVAWVRRLEPEGPVVPIYIGDDRTDEDAFRLLRAEWPNAVTVRVGGPDDTAAEFHVDSPDAVRALIEALADR